MMNQLMVKRSLITTLLVFIALNGGVLWHGSLFGQSASDNYILQVGNVVWGGGYSAAEERIITGNIPYQGAGHSSAKNRVITCGVMASIYSNGNTFLASYLGREIDTVEIRDRRMEVIFGGDTGTVTGALLYRSCGRQQYTNVSLLPSTGDTLYYDLSADLINLRGLEFYFTITRNQKTVSLGHSSNPGIFITELTNTQGQCPVSLPETTYAMVSIPIDIVNENQANEVFPDDLGPSDCTRWRLGYFDSVKDTIFEYPYLPDVIPGRAYWLIMRYPESFGAAGYTVMPDFTYLNKQYYRLPLMQGWNQIANPFAFPIRWQEILFNYNGSVIGHDTLIIDRIAYFFNGYAYTSASILQPWEGFFIYVKKPGVEIMFPYCEASEEKKLESSGLSLSGPEAMDWTLHFQLKADGFVDDGNFIGTHPDATPGSDWFDLADPPPPGGPRLSFELPDKVPPLRRVDIRPPLEDGTIWNLCLTSPRGGYLSIIERQSLPENLHAWLVLEPGTIIPLLRDTTIFISSDVHTARLFIGNSNYIRNEINPLLPEDYALYQNYPNPFNPETTIRFALPAAGHVRLDILNILGQKVTTLLDREMPAGVSNVVWDGTSGSGHTVATGIYFYRLTSGTFTQSKKMILLK